MRTDGIVGFLFGKGIFKCKDAKILLLSGIFLLILLAPLYAQDTSSFKIVPIYEIYPSQFGKYTYSTSPVIKPHSKITIREGVFLGVERSLTLKIARQKIEQAIVNFQKVKNLKKPVVNLEGTSMFNGPASGFSFRDPFTGKKIDINFTRNYNHLARLSLEWLITTFGRVKHQRSAAFLKIQAERENFEVEKSKVILSLKKALFNILKADKAVDVAMDYVDSAKDHLQIAKVLYKEGMVSKYDLVRANLTLSQAKEALISAQKMQALSRAYFLTLANIDSDIPFDVIPPPPIHFDVDKVSLKNLQNIALENRCEVKALKKNISSYMEVLKSVKKSNNPTLAFFGNYDRQTGTFITDDYAWRVGLNLKIPIYDGDVRNTNIKEAEVVLKTLNLSLEALKSQIKMEVKKAYLDLIEAKAKLETAEQDVITAKEGYRMARARYLNGLSTSVEMEDSLRALHKAQVNLVTSEYNYAVCFAELERAMGVQIWTYRVPEVKENPH